MKDIADDLLDDLEELEHSSSQLESNVENVIKNQQTLNKLSGESAMESAVFMLEASKLAQDSAINSQLAAEVNLKLAKEQKIQIDDLHEANNSWRQAMGTATQEIKGSRGFFTGMLITAIILGLIVSALIGGMLFTTNQHNTQFKAELIDLIQTETTLNHRQTTMKIDELASIIELLGNGPRNNKIDTQKNGNQTNAPLELENSQSEAIENISLAEIDYERLQRLITEALNEQKLVIASWLKQTPNITEKPDLPSSDNETSLAKNIVEPAKIDLSTIEAHYAKIDEQLKLQLAQIALIKQQLDAKQQTSSVVAPIKQPAEMQNVNVKHQVELNKALNNQLAAMKKQLDLLQTKQDEINKGLANLSKEIQKNQPPKDDGDKPYSYRNPYEYKQ